tara:strand:- start:1247 stop:1573 length:327 start_codon:yes stop_codon:yes gene_type:complete
LFWATAFGLTSANALELLPVAILDSLTPNLTMASACLLTVADNAERPQISASVVSGVPVPVMAVQEVSIAFEIDLAALAGPFLSGPILSRYLWPVLCISLFISGFSTE